jgi:hypothetical protein
MEDGKCRATQDFVNRARDEQMHVVEVPLPDDAA